MVARPVCGTARAGPIQVVYPLAGAPSFMAAPCLRTVAPTVSAPVGTVRFECDAERDPTGKNPGAGVFVAARACTERIPDRASDAVMFFGR